MKILITGANGFVGKNIAAALTCIRDGKDRVHTLNGLSNPAKLEIISYDINSSWRELEDACRNCSFVFHLAGVNRPKQAAEFMEGNCGFTEKLLRLLQKNHNACPVMMASSIQASLTGRYENSDYGKSKLAGEGLIFSHARATGAKALVYRFPNLFGKWCRPDYNSAVATFCHHIARNLPIQVNDRSTELELVYIDDLVEEMICALNKQEHRCEYDGAAAKAEENGRFCFVPQAYKKTLGEIADLLEAFQAFPQTLVAPEMPCGSFEKKLYATYVSYLPPGRMRFPLRMHEDGRGSFTELMRTAGSGQFSVNVSRPGVAKGQHWHHTKWEIFVVVSGHGLIQEQKTGTDTQGKPYPVIEFEVCGENMEAVYMLPGYAHRIVNLSDTEDLITFMWANEQFESGRPDTFSQMILEE